jgi:NAD(P)-dependent dehydrogenase (short-subunit alcohol dehydrogenase family)
MTDRLSGKVAIVTGAASTTGGVGIGYATAMLFAREGAHVLLVNRSKDRVDALCSAITAEGGEASVFVADISRRDQVAKMIDAAVERYGRLDILFNNAGVGGPGTAVNLDEAVWHSVLSTNLSGTMWCCRHAIPRMIESGGGSIINVSSLVAVQGFERGDIGFTPYAASKAGLHGLTLAIAADFGTQGIRANCLLVGMVHTPQLERFGDAARERRRSAVPLKTEGTPWDVAWAAVYLASDESRWVTGTSLPIDGGQLAVREFPR